MYLAQKYIIFSIHITKENYKNAFLFLMAVLSIQNCLQTPLHCFPYREDPIQKRWGNLPPDHEGK